MSFEVEDRFLISINEEYISLTWYFGYVLKFIVLQTNIKEIQFMWKLFIVNIKKISAVWFFMFMQHLVYYLYHFDYFTLSINFNVSFRS